MPYVGFEPMIPASCRAKIVYALDRAATVTGRKRLYNLCKHNSVQYTDKVCTESIVTWAPWQRGCTRAETTVQQT
jgi:hypothetical protein